MFFKWNLNWNKHELKTPCTVSDLQSGAVCLVYGPLHISEEDSQRGNADVNSAGFQILKYGHITDTKLYCGNLEEVWKIKTKARPSRYLSFPEEISIIICIYHMDVRMTMSLSSNTSKPGGYRETDAVLQLCWCCYWWNWTGIDFTCILLICFICYCHYGNTLSYYVLLSDGQSLQKADFPS